MLFVTLTLSKNCSRCYIFFFQAEDGIRDLVRSRGLGDVYKRQDKGDANIGDLVRAELTGRGPAVKAKVVERLGDPFAPKSLSMIAIARHEIPHVFGAETLSEAEVAAKLPLTVDGREDLRGLPIVAIDPIDARDHDDAVWAEPDTCLLYTSPSPRDRTRSRMPSSA